MAESEITQTTSDLRTLVEVKDLKTHFFLHEGTVRAVDGVSFNIYEGRSLGVIGESGCGKSVTAQSMMRIVPYAARPGSGRDDSDVSHAER